MQNYLFTFIMQVPTKVPKIITRENPTTICSDEKDLRKDDQQSFQTQIFDQDSVKFPH
jgi:hypothetical protein